VTSWALALDMFWMGDLPDKFSPEEMKDSDRLENFVCNPDIDATC